MKKLMVAIAAVAVSAFAWAEGGAYEADSVEDGLTKWSETTGDSAQGDYEADGVTPYTYSTTERYGGFVGTNTKYLKVKNSLGKESIDLAFDSVAVADSVCFDTLVNFTNGCEDDIAELPDGSKLAVWLKELAAADDEENGVGETNLYVRAGFYDGQAYVEKNFQIPNSGVEPGSWHRVTVSTIANVLANGDNKLPGFVVYLDGVLVAHNDPDKIGRTGLDTVAAAYNNNNQLFISAKGEEENPTISALGFSGTGLADDASIVYGDAIPAFAQAATLTISADEGVTGFKYSIGGAAPVPVEGDSATAQIQVGQTVVLTDITVADSETAARKVVEDLTEWDYENLTVSGNGFEFTGGATASLTIGVEETAFIVKVNGVGYTDEEEAIAAIDALTSGSVSFLGEDGFAYAEGAKGTITFNQGDTITVREDDSAWLINSEGEITITDVKAGAEIIVQTGDVEVEGTIAGTLIVNGKCTVSAELMLSGTLKSIGDDSSFVCEDQNITLDGEGTLVTKEAQTADVIFTEPETGKKIEPTEVAEGWQYTLADDKVTITVTATGALVSGIDTGDYTVGEEVQFTVTADTENGYTTPIVVKADGVTLEADAGTYTFTVGSNASTISVEATLSKVTATFKDGESVVDTQVIDWNTAPTNVVLSKAHFTFNGWDKDYTLPIKADTTYQAQWQEDAKFDVTFTTNNLPMADKTINVYTGTTLTAAQIPELTGGSWDVNPIDAVITCVTNFNYTIAAPAPVDPVDPEEPKTYDDPDKATAAANAINADKPNMIKSPAAAGLTGEAQAAYANRFEAVAEGNTVTVKLIDTEKANLEKQAADDTKEIPVSVIAAAEDDTDQTIAATPGFFYSVIANDSLEGMKVRSCECAKGDTVTVTIPHYENSGFYTIKASVKAQTPEAAFEEDK